MLSLRIAHGKKSIRRRDRRKDVTWRLQHIGDARLELRETSEVAATSQVAATSPVSLAMALIASIVTGAIVWSVMRHAAPPELPVQRLSLRIPDTDRFGAPTETLGSSVAISPNGRDLVYVAIRDGLRQLFHRPLERSEAGPMLGTAGAVQPFFSPDGEWVAFFAGGKLMKVSLHGGQVATISEADMPNPTGGTWGSGDRNVFTPSLRQGLFIVSAQGGEARPITKLIDGEISHRWPTILHRGDVLLYEAVESSNTSRILAETLATGDREGYALTLHDINGSKSVLGALR